MSTARVAARAAFARLRRLAQTERERRVAEWISAGKDRTLRLDYDLGPGSIVLDVGGYVGQWASDIYARFRCTVHVFEPVRTFADEIERRFARNPDVHVHPFGLGGATREEAFSIAGVGSTVLDRPGRTAERRELVPIVAAADFLTEVGIDAVALAKVNVEGGEYELLEHLLDAGLAPRFRNLQVQFHDFVPDARARMESIQQRLAATRRLTWQEEFIWENWLRVDPGRGSAPSSEPRDDARG